MTNSIKPAPGQRKIKRARFPQDEKQWKKIADEMQEWADLDTSINFDEFPLSLGYSPSRFKKWKENNADFSEAMEYAMYKVGTHRENLAHLGKMDRVIVLKTMPLYHYEYKALLQVHVDRQNQERAAKAALEDKVFNFIAKAMPPSELVKPLEKSHE